jgi:hypothetical protein
VVGLEGKPELETNPSKLPEYATRILAACHALVFVDNKLVRHFYLFLLLLRWLTGLAVEFDCFGYEFQKINSCGSEDAACEKVHTVFL